MTPALPTPFPALLPLFGAPVPADSARQAAGDARGRMQALIARWAQRGWLRPLDAAFAGFLWREVPDADPLLVLAAALASHQLGRGHVCLDLAATLADPALALSLPPEAAGGEDEGADDLPARVLAGLELARWQRALDDPRLVGRGAGATPLVAHGTRLYLRRYWQYEQAVGAALDARLARSAALAATLPQAALRAALDALFPAAAGPVPIPAPDWQKLACALAARSAFAIVTGGPGTGKTTTVVKLLALLQALALSAPASGGVPARALRIRLAAPTGKAAARLNEAIAGAVARLALDGLAQGEAVRAAIPTTVGTLHRLLGSRPDSRRFRHDARNPLALDVLVIDEASMIDLEMMAAVLAALPAGSRLILLGDKDQLASVEAGAVLGELCAQAHRGRYTPATAAWLRAVSGQDVAAALVDPAGSALDQAVAMLRHSFRFAAGSAIGRLAAAVNAGAAEEVVQVLAASAGAQEALQWIVLDGEDDAVLRRLVIEGGAAERGASAGAAPGDRGGARRRGYRHYLEEMRRRRPSHTAGAAAVDAWARAVLQAHAEFQLLCALRRGPWGVEGLNVRVARMLHAAGLIPAVDGWYAGRPVLVTRNDYALGLMNGDIGITLAVPEPAAEGGTEGGEGGAVRLRVAFAAGDGSGGIRWVLPSRLQAVETVFALTVHKSQGSEFTHTALVLPERPAPILTRELLYTGITRARSFLTLATAGGAALVAQAVHRRVVRASGLRGEDGRG
ncbi:exodeoxyribonuclease V subunit alpha [Thauera aromatica]|nr:exodeoxyribonuclease V subunit alpha [Thauera aromatica]MCK2126615.1 exodeoxyribonuclease V subunit alpha [Thauera aromatica]